MASLQADAAPAEYVIAETEAKSNEPQVVAPPPPAAEAAETVKAVDVEDEDDLDDFTEPSHEEKVENSDYEDEIDREYSPFIVGEDAPAYGYVVGEPARFGDFNEDEDDDDAIV